MEAVKTRLTPKQALFVQKYINERKPAYKAYAEAYEQPISPSVEANSSRLVNKENIQAFIQDMKQKYRDAAPHAFQVQQNMLDDPKTPANVRNDIAKDIQNRGELAAAQRVEQATVFKGLTDSEDWAIEALKKITQRGTVG